MNNFENIESLKRRFNWGAFFLGWIWGLFNNSYITLVGLPLIFIPKIGGIIGIILAIYFGIKGNSLALKNKKFNSEFDFIKFQKILSYIGALIVISPFILLMIFSEMAALHPAGYDFTLTEIKIKTLFIILFLEIFTFVTLIIRESLKKNLK